MSAVVTVLAALGPAAKARAQPSAAEDELSAVDTFPRQVDAEVVRGSELRISGSFVFFLPTGDAGYLPLSQALAERLSAAPRVSGGVGVRTVSVGSDCAPVQAVYITDQHFRRLRAGRLRWNAVLAVETGAPAGKRTVQIDFPEIHTALSMLSDSERIDESVVPKVVVTLNVWSSEGEKQEVARTTQVKIASMRAAYHGRLLRWGGAGGGTLLVLVIAFLLLRHRLWPDVEVEVQPGSHLQKREAISRRRSDAGVPLGTLVETVWARRYFRRRPIKVEYLLGVSNDSHDGDTAAEQDLHEQVVQIFTHGEDKATKPLRWSGNTARLDVLVSVGRSVKRGRYIAKGAHGSVSVRVR